MRGAGAGVAAGSVGGSAAAAPPASASSRRGASGLDQRIHGSSLLVDASRSGCRGAVSVRPLLPRESFAGRDRNITTVFVHGILQRGCTVNFRARGCRGRYRSGETEEAHPRRLSVRARKGQVRVRASGHGRDPAGRFGLAAGLRQRAGLGPARDRPRCLPLRAACDQDPDRDADAARLRQLETLLLLGRVHPAVACRRLGPAALGGWIFSAARWSEVRRWIRCAGCRDVLGAHPRGLLKAIAKVLLGRAITLCCVGRCAASSPRWRLRAAGTGDPHAVTMLGWSGARGSAPRRC